MFPTSWLRPGILGLGVMGIALSGSAIAPSAGGLTPRETRVFQEICATCHAHAGIGVPVIGDEAEWQRRRSKGPALLLTHTVEGWGNMPPLGTCSFCSEAELRRLVAFIAGLPLDDAP